MYAESCVHVQNKKKNNQLTVPCAAMQSGLASRSFNHSTNIGPIQSSAIRLMKFVSNPWYSELSVMSYDSLRHDMLSDADIIGYTMNNQYYYCRW